jgi:phage replication O-like protein O
MANPQKENGFTLISNEILDALILECPGFSEGRVLFAVIRKTYGWKKKEDRLSITQLCKMTGLSRRTVIYAIKNLEAKNMITVRRSKVNEFNEINIISFQKNYDLWVVQEIDGSARKCKSYKATIQKQKDIYKSRVVQEIDGSARNGKKVVQETVYERQFLAPTKETITKENIQKKDTYTDDFLKFYDAYPKHKAKEDAFKAWKSMNGKRPSIEKIITAIEEQKKSDDWVKEGGRYIPFPATWLRAARWDDEIENVGLFEEKKPWEL